MNGTLFQAFEWYLSDGGNFYQKMTNRIKELKEIGVSSIWLPPVFKATGVNDTGYGTYDLYDLGEFDQKGSIRTKYGKKEELQKLIKTAHDNNLRVYADVVLNHKAGADETEKFTAVMVDKNNREKEVEKPKEIEGWTKFNFNGRKDQYSDFKWNYHHFSGVDYDNKTGINAIFKILGENKGWNKGVSYENGNFDYLMFADINLAHPQVKKELKSWALWFIEQLNLDGFRFDALKHMDQVFIKELIEHIKAKKGDDFYIMGEYWQNDIDENNRFLDAVDYKADIFDVGLHFNLNRASKLGSDYDLRKIFDNTIVQSHPLIAVTFVDNHDSQPNQSLESFVEDWFKEIAYALILLRKDGYPCIFYGDYYGLKDRRNFKNEIARLSKIRNKFCYGNQDDYFNEKNCIGWLRHGDQKHPHKCAVVISNKDKSKIKMFVGKNEANKIYADYIGNSDAKIKIDEEGYGLFEANPNSVSVWIEDNQYL